jgi:Rps23 Pro-64 3,4-dihydroxylase Tpa1-like proline 4-hydroxylase
MQGLFQSKIMNIVPDNISEYLSEINSKDLFHWGEMSQFLPQELFDDLNDSYPDLDKFDKHTGIQRIHDQRPHDRYYLAYSRSIYGSNKTNNGVIEYEELSEAWKVFVDEILHSGEYHDFIRGVLGVEEFDIRLAWHMAFNGCEVSPHLDAVAKYGTHLFYFNTDKDWKNEWGGGTVLMEGKRVEAMNPEFTDFDHQIVESSIINNKSFIFQNSDASWHGVKRINCPEGIYRRIFTVVFEKKGTGPSAGKKHSFTNDIVKKISKMWNRAVTSR